MNSWIFGSLVFILLIQCVSFARASCLSPDCNGHGTCISDSFCQCEDGWSGKDDIFYNFGVCFFLHLVDCSDVSLFSFSLLKLMFVHSWIVTCLCCLAGLSSVSWLCFSHFCLFAWSGTSEISQVMHEESDLSSQVDSFSCESGGSWSCSFVFLIGQYVVLLLACINYLHHLLIYLPGVVTGSFVADSIFFSIFATPAPVYRMWVRSAQARTPCFFLIAFQLCFLSLLEQNTAFANCVVCVSRCLQEQSAMLPLMTSLSLNLSSRKSEHEVCFCVSFLVGCLGYRCFLQLWLSLSPYVSISLCSLCLSLVLCRLKWVLFLYFGLDSLLVLLGCACNICVALFSYPSSWFPFAAYDAAGSSGYVHDHSLSVLEDRANALSSTFSLRISLLYTQLSMFVLLLLLNAISLSYFSIQVERYLAETQAQLSPLRLGAFETSTITNSVFYSIFVDHFFSSFE